VIPRTSSSTLTVEPAGVVEISDMKGHGGTHGWSIGLTVRIMTRIWSAGRRDSGGEAIAIVENSFHVEKQYYISKK